MLQIGTMADAFRRSYASHGGDPVQLNVMACCPMPSTWRPSRRPQRTLHTGGRLRIDAPGSRSRGLAATAVGARASGGIRGLTAPLASLATQEYMLLPNLRWKHTRNQHTLMYAKGGRMPLPKCLYVGACHRQPRNMRAMIQAGMTVARLNFSHGTAAEKQRTAAMVRQVAAEEGRYVALMGDLQGPKIRIGKLPEGGVSLVAGKEVVLVAGENTTAPDEIPFPHPDIVADIKLGTGCCWMMPRLSCSSSLPNQTA